MQGANVKTTSHNLLLCGMLKKEAIKIQSLTEPWHEEGRSWSVKVLGKSHDDGWMLLDI